MYMLFFVRLRSSFFFLLLLDPFLIYIYNHPARSIYISNIMKGRPRAVAAEHANTEAVVFRNFYLLPIYGRSLIRRLLGPTT